MKQHKSPTVWHEVMMWTGIAGIGFGVWWLYVMWPVYNSGGPAAMLTAGLQDWRLYATWACLATSLVLFALGEKRIGRDPFRKPGADGNPSRKHVER